jgi:hypothetical protein
MKSTKIIGGLAAVAATLAFSPFASAEVKEGFKLDKFAYGAQETINLSYDVAEKCDGKATSNAILNGVSSEFKLDPPTTMRATAQATWAPGYYTIEMTCDGEKVSRPFRVVHTDELTFFLDKEIVEAGGDVTVMKGPNSTCGDAANSPAFVERVELKQEPDGVWRGKARAIDTPGTYQVAMLCNHDTHTFRDLMIIPKTPTRPQPPAAAPEKPKAKAPIVKPKGAPQTGGGGTA